MNDRRSLFLALVAALAVTAAGCGTARNNGVESQACQGCHGGASGNAAPPFGVNGDTATTALGVGAHQAHLGPGTFAAPVSCDECHVVPADDAAHLDGVATVTFSGRAVAGQPEVPAATWNRGSATCSNVTCHAGTSPMGGSFTAPVWNAAGQAHLDCGSCHGYPPPNHRTNAAAAGCNACHPQTVKPDGTIDLATGKHIDGSAEWDEDLVRCNGCHDAPPDTGAHRAHVAILDLPSLAYGLEWRTAELDPTGATGGYTFGCGTCHPKNVDEHRNGVVDVELDPAVGDPGGLKALNAPGAAYADGRCSGVYCHSSGQASPAFQTTPGWASGEALGCGGCHGNPPSYPNGGPDGAANSHIFLAYTGREAGHFAGLPGPTFHRSRHGNPTAFPTAQQASPITCQTCHAATVDPANVMPGGVFYLDTGITTQLAGGSAARLTDAAWRDTQCLTCHDGGPASPPQGAGKVRTPRHVDGSRDVAFDQRSGADLPAGWFGGLGASAPTRPYFMTGATFFTGYTLPADAGWDPPTPPPAAGQRNTLSYQLGSAGYEPATRTCSSVACHLGNGVRWGQQDFETSPPSCTGCHAIE
jgi:predicted CxxxxCH...CXXCH cytochrome family protein